MSNDCYWELIDRISAIHKEDGRELLLDLFSEPCLDKNCPVHGEGGLSLKIIRLADQHDSDTELMEAVTSFLRSA